MSRGLEMVSTDAKTHLAPLTGLRFFAAFHVFVYHLYHLLIGSEGRLSATAETALDAGYVAVNLFFVLSGFILGYNYAPERISSSEQKHTFWVARTARLYPVYMLALLLAAPLFVRRLVVAGELGPEVFGVLLTPTLLQSWFPQTALAWNQPAWSLSAEAFFYACFPLLALKVGRLSSRGAWFAGLAAFAASLLVPAIYLVLNPDGFLEKPTAYDSGIWLDAIRYNPLLRLPEFVLGVVTARLFALRSNQAPAAWKLYLVLALLGLAYVSHKALPFPLLHNGLLAPLFAALIYLLPLHRGGLARLLSTRPLQRLGEASYALYILHEPTLLLGASAFKRVGLDKRSMLAVCISIVCTVALSLLVFRYFEAPMRQKITRRWSQRREPLAVAPTNG